MKILAALLSFLIIGSKGAETDSNTETDPSSTKGIAKIPLGNLPAGIFVSIGSFLSFPNGRLACANKKMKKTFIESFPFERFLTERFDLINLQGLNHYGRC